MTNLQIVTCNIWTVTARPVTQILLHASRGPALLYSTFTFQQFPASLAANQACTTDHCSGRHWLTPELAESWSFASLSSRLVSHWLAGWAGLFRFCYVLFSVYLRTCKCGIPRRFKHFFFLKGFLNWRGLKEILSKCNMSKYTKR